MTLEKGAEILAEPVEKGIREVSGLPERLENPRESDYLPDKIGKPSESDCLPDKLESGRQESKVLDAPETTQDNRSRPLEKVDTRETAELQSTADQAARDYNSKFLPFERAQKKGFSDVEKTTNGGISFENSTFLYKNEQGEKAIARIEATGSRTKDFDAANKAVGLKETPEGYVWHHRDDYDVKTNTFTLELVKDDAHNATKPHSGGCAQYDAVYGPIYNR